MRGRPIPDCPGRCILRAVKRTEGPLAIAGANATTTEHKVEKARDTVVVTWLDGWGLISYARSDGSWLHTANTPDGFRRKLADLGIPDPTLRSPSSGNVASSRASETFVCGDADED